MGWLVATKNEFFKNKCSRTLKRMKMLSLTLILMCSEIYSIFLRGLQPCARLCLITIYVTCHNQKKVRLLSPIVKLSTNPAIGKIEL